MALTPKSQRIRLISVGYIEPPDSQLEFLKSIQNTVVDGHVMSGFTEEQTTVFQEFVETGFFVQNEGANTFSPHKNLGLAMTLLETPDFDAGFFQKYTLK